MYRKRDKRQQKRHFAADILLSIIWTFLFTGATGRPSLDTKTDISHSFLDEVLANSNEEILFKELKKFNQRQSINYATKWPALKDLVSIVEYDDNALDSNDLINYTFLQRLKQLAATTSDNYEEVRNENLHFSDEEDEENSAKRLKSTGSVGQLKLKEHNVKKNVQFRKQYMSPCHFKICNMGRKRNARLLTQY